MRGLREQRVDQFPEKLQILLHLRVDDHVDGLVGIDPTVSFLDSSRSISTDSRVAPLPMA